MLTGNPFSFNSEKYSQRNQLEMQTKELYNSSTQVSTSIYFLKVTATFNLLTGGYKRSIATDYQENLITSDQQLKKNWRKRSREYQLFLVHATKLQKVFWTPVIIPSPYLNEFQFPGKDESTKLKYCAVLLV